MYRGIKVLQNTCIVLTKLANVVVMLIQLN